LSYGQANGDQFLQDHSVKSAALGAAMNYVADQASAAKAHFGLTDADIATKITAHVAKDLALATPIPPAAAPVVVVDPAAPPVAPEPPKPSLAPATPAAPTPVAPINPMEAPHA
jgi:outer membrane biosynthesis protein TonB